MDLHPYYPLLARTPLLRGMRPDELDTLLDCFAPRQDILKSRTIRAARSPAKYKDVLS